MEFVLVTSKNYDEFLTLYDSMYRNREVLHFLSSYYEKPELKHTFNDEQYLIVNPTILNISVAIGFFQIHKSHTKPVASIYGFYLKEDFRNRGISLEVAYFIARRVFIELGYNSINVDAWATNSAAVNTYDKLMKRVGIRKEHYYFNREYHDQILWQLTFKDSVFYSNPGITFNEFKAKIKG